jgi:hypothetical protein
MPKKKDMFSIFLGAVLGSILVYFSILTFYQGLQSSFIVGVFTFFFGSLFLFSALRQAVR